MTLVGFKRATIGILGPDGAILPEKKWVIEGKTDGGATSSAEITGLSKEPTKVYGSDVLYYISQKGTGDVSINLGVLDLPEECNDAILGYKAGTTAGVSFVGEDTEPPTCALMLESKDLDGTVVMLAFFKGKFSRDGITLGTLTNEANSPEAEAYVFAAMADDKEGESKGQTLGKFIGKDDTTAEAFTALVFPDPAQPQP